VMSIFKRRPLVVITGLVLALAAACSDPHPQSTFDTHGPVSASQANIFYIIMYAGLVVFIGVMALIIYAAIRYRRRYDDKDPEQIHGNNTLEIAWTVAPALLLVAVAVPSIQTLWNTTITPEPAAMTVRATGNQWWFEFEIEELGVVTANELHIPVGEVINFELESKDVIHSFWVPKLAGKVDMVPNNTNTTWLQADDVGEYFGQCAEFCGESHANMRFKVVAESREDFDAWVEAQLAESVAPADPLVQQGHDIFMSIEAGCWACHTIRGSANAFGQVGPDLTHFASRRHMAAGIMENNHENLVRWLTDPNDVKPGNVMSRDAAVYNDPDQALSEPQVAALAAYLRSLE
jgi:cytochrome c oxidase subunit 2